MTRRTTRWSAALGAAFALGLLTPVGISPAHAGPESSGSAVVGTPVKAATGDVVLTGRGFGHGHGMSQYGAKGRAEAGHTYSQITSFYYPGTSLVTDGDSKTIDVWISTDNDNNETWVIAEPGMSLQTSNPDSGAPASAWTPLPAYVIHSNGAKVVPTAWRLALDSLTFRLQGFYQGSWFDHDQATITTILSNTKRASLSAADGTVRLIVGSRYIEHRGVISANRTTNGSPATVSTTVTTTMANYLRSVVPAEMPASWSAAAVQAQSVAARTYASHDRDVASRPWWYDTCDTTQCQVYRGAGLYSGTGVLLDSYEDSRASAAINATSGRILTYGGRPAFTQFSASNGGHTAAGSQPYLVAKPDPYDAYPGWSVTLTPAQVSAKYPQVGAFQRFEVTRDGLGPYGGRAVTVRIVGASGTVTVTGNQFRSAFGLRSTLWQSSSATPPPAPKPQPRPPLPPLTPLVTPQRDWDGNVLNDLIGRGPDGSLYLYSGRGPATWYARQQIGRGWHVMGFMTQVHNFSGTGRPEIITTDPATGRLWLYPGTGAGSFAKPRVIGNGWQEFTMLIGVQDWHQRGQAALIGRDAAGRLWLYPSNGAGGFVAKRLIGNGWNVMDVISFAGDFNGDGRTDLIAREAANGRLWLYPGTGTGSFGARKQIGNGWQVMDMILSGADWDRDGRIDVIARDPKSGDLWIYPGDGRGGFQDRRQVGNGWIGFDLVS